ncbi:MAG: hypothetical protein QOF82_1182 [Frankiales bacterium]|jgi:hypothetical protein|nr:hypothetical protein [Frankiales bacterium]MDX6212095.1 hypothetical protein [Frankiales bacterium]
MLDHRYCPVCQAETEVELLPCLDGHGEDCTERVCIGCSSAIFAGLVPANGLRRAS